MYSQSSPIYDALYHFKDYKEASDRLISIIRDNHPRAHSLLDVACGTGKHLEHLRVSFDVEGLDINQQLLEQARTRLPTTPLHHADMMDFTLGKTFDVVACLFSSITYVKSVNNLEQTIKTMSGHVASGGLLIVEPLFPPESYRVGEITMNTVDQPNLKIVWMYISERVDCLARLRINYMVGTPHDIETFVEVHDLGLFTHDDYVQAFAKAGFKAEYDKIGLMKRGLYIAKRTV